MVNGPLTPALSLRERELEADRVDAAGGDLLPLPQGEGWGEGTRRRRSPASTLMQSFTMMQRRMSGLVALDLILRLLL